MLTFGDRVALVACSDGLTSRDRLEYTRLCTVLEEIGLDVVESPHLFVPDLPLGPDGTLRPDYTHPAPDAVRAAVVEGFFVDPDVVAIFDVSGGDLAGGVLSHLDLGVVARHPTPFFGYSDLTTIVNAIHTRTGQVSYLWSVRNLVRSDADAQLNRFRRSLQGRGDDLFTLDARLVRGDGMAGPLAGGNLRCLLKLAGTPHFPDLRGRVLALESAGATTSGLYAGLHQLRQMGVLDEAAGVLLGTFTALQRDCGPDAPARIALEVLDPRLPVAVTRDFGHDADARALRVGAWWSCAATRSGAPR